MTDLTALLDARRVSQIPSSRNPFEGARLWAIPTKGGSQK